MKINLPQKNIVTDWKVIPLENLSNKISDGIHTTPKYSDNGDYYFINGNNLYDSKVNFTLDNKRVDYSEYLKHRKDLDKNNTILLSINGTIGTVAYYNDEKVVLGKSCAYITLNSNVNRSFIFYFLNSYNTKKYFISELTGSTIQNLSIKSIKSFPVKLPPLPEQNRIVSVLEVWDQAIEKLKQKIEVKKEIKKGLMQNLLTGKTRLDGFKDEWKQVRLKDICTVVMGQSPDSVSYNDLGIGLPLIQGNNDIKNRKTISRVWTTQITKTAKKGDAIMTVRAPVGLIGVASNDACIGRGICAFQSVKINSDFLLKLLESYENKWKTLEQGSTFSAVNGSDIKELSINIPVSKKEQDAIADILIAITKEIDLLRQKLSILKDQKKYLLNNLVTGTIRTPETLSIYK